VGDEREGKLWCKREELTVTRRKGKEKEVGSGKWEDGL